MPRESITPHFGTEVTGECRFEQPALEAEFDSVMTGSNGATLFGLRRVGKSTEALACAERLRARPEPFVVIWQKAEGMTSEAHLLVEVLKQMPSQGWRDRITSAIADDNAIAASARDALGKLTGSHATDVQAYFGPIAAAIERTVQKSDRVVLMIDELPWLCRTILEGDPTGGRRRVDVLLASLRRWRNKGVRMLLLGSVGVVGLGRQHRLDLSHLNDLTPLEVPPLDPDAARTMVRALVAGGEVRDWTDAHTGALLSESAALYTSMLQRGFLALTVGGKAAPLATVPELFATKVRPDLDATFYRQFDKRVQLYRELTAPLSALLASTLKCVLSAPEPAPLHALREAAGASVDAADLGDALSMLREDGFLNMRALRDGSQMWRPASSLVTAWWTQKRGGIA